jgi:hypothetical protein
VTSTDSWRRSSVASVHANKKFHNPYTTALRGVVSQFHETRMTMKKISVPLRTDAYEPKGVTS